MVWIVGILTLMVISFMIFQKIRNKQINGKAASIKAEEHLTEIIKQNEKPIHINLPSKVVHVKRESKNALFIGQIIFGKYEILKVIKIGQLSHVYLVKHLILGNKWCLKLITTYDTTGLFQEEGFLREMNHQMIPKMIDIFYEGNLVYIIEEYIEGRALSTLLKAKGQFNEVQLIQWGIELCEIFEYLHEKLRNPIIYRDLKPENIMVSHNNHLVLIDFGLAKFKTSKKEDLFTSGTKLFAPQEQFSAQGMTDELTDLYSIGMIFIYLILENDSEERIHLNKLTRFVSKDYAKVLLKAINEKRHRRYTGVRELKEALKSLRLGRREIFSRRKKLNL